MAVSDYSTTPSLNTSISGINIGEGCAPANINNAMRQMMADVKSYNAGQIPFTPASGIAATTVQAAIVEARSDAIAAIPGSATTATAGLMTAGDKIKLNGIAAGATANEGASQATWNGGANAEEKLISPAKLHAKMASMVPGVGQTWQNVRSSRARMTSYQNTTGRPIVVSVYLNGATGQAYAAAAEVSVNGDTWVVVAGALNENSWASLSFIVPPGHYYRVRGNTGANDLQTWAELR